MNAAPDTRSDVGHILERHLHDAAAGGGLRGDGNAPDGLEALPIRRGETHHHRKMPVAAALVQVAGALAADRRLNHGIDVAGREAIARRAHAIHVDADRRLAQRTQHREIRDARHLGQHRGDAIGGLLQRLQIVAVDLDGILALDAEAASSTLSWMYCEKLKSTPGNCCSQRVGHLLGELLLGDAAPARRRRASTARRIRR